MPIQNNQHLIKAYRDYMVTRHMVKHGLLCNVSRSREQLRATYRLLAGKPL